MNFGRKRLSITAAVAGVAAIGGATLVALGPAGAANTTPEFVGWSGGSRVIALGGAVASDYTAVSAIDTISTGQRTSNRTANASVKGLLTLGAIETSEQTSALLGGAQLTSHARTTGVNLLNGAITATAVDTTATAKLVNGVTSFASQTTFIGLHIVGVNLPLTIPKNFTVTIPGLATVVLNAAVGAPSADGTVRADAAGLYLSLLKGQGSSPAGTEVFLNPSHAEIAKGVPSNAMPVGGFGYGTKVSAAAGNTIGVNSDPTAFNVIGQGGTGGNNFYNRTFGLNLGGVIQAGVITTTANALAGTKVSTSSMTVEIAGLNLLGGLIRADALKGVASTTQLAGAAPTFNKSTQLVNLVIAGAQIPVNVSPNTVIDVAGIGRITINQQVISRNVVAVRLLDIKLSTAKFGLPIGAEIEVGAAAAWIGHP